MPIVKTVKGDVFKVAAEPWVDMFAHGANCVNTMGAGVALGVTKFMKPLAYADLATHRGDIRKLGSYSMTRFMYAEKDLYGFNLYTQFTPRINASQIAVDYTAVANAFNQLDMWVAKALFSSNPQVQHVNPNLVIPQIGSGLAGGDWKKISKIINEHTPNINVTVVEYDK